MSEFDKAKALREQIRGLEEVGGAINNRLRLLENQHTMLEQEVNVMHKIAGFVRIELETKKVQLYEATK